MKTQAIHAIAVIPIKYAVQLYKLTANKKIELRKLLNIFKSFTK